MGWSNAIPWTNAYLEGILRILNVPDLMKQYVAAGICIRLNFVCEQRFMVVRFMCVMLNCFIFRVEQLILRIMTHIVNYAKNTVNTLNAYGHPAVITLKHHIFFETCTGFEKNLEWR